MDTVWDQIKSCTYIDCRSMFIAYKAGCPMIPYFNIVNIEFNIINFPFSVFG